MIEAKTLADQRDRAAKDRVEIQRRSDQSADLGGGGKSLVLMLQRLFGPFGLLEQPGIFKGQRKLVRHLSDQHLLLIGPRACGRFVHQAQGRPGLLVLLKRRGDDPTLDSAREIRDAERRPARQGLTLPWRRPFALGRQRRRRRGLRCRRAGRRCSGSRGDFLLDYVGEDALKPLAEFFVGHTPSALGQAPGTVGSLSCQGGSG